MDISAFWAIAAVLLLVVANGFFVATEFAIVAVRKSRLDQLAKEGRAGAAAAKDVVGHLDSYIAACQLGITMASLGLGWIGEPAVAGVLAKPLTALLGPAGAPAAHGITVGIAFALITALHIVIGELAPKGVALQRAEATSLFVAYPIQIFYKLFRWPITALNAVGNGVLRMVGLDGTAGHEMVHSVEELRMLVTASQAAGAVEASEARIAARAFQFADLTAGELMTPRRDLVGIPADSTFEAILTSVRQAERTRFPVYQGSFDDVIGVLHVSALAGMSNDPGHTFNIRTAINPAPFVPVTRKADAVLEDMRTGGHAMVIVVDEYGVTAGVLTLHDLFEGLVGRMEADGSGNAVGQPLPDGSRLFAGVVRLGEFEEATGIRIPEDEREEADTLNGLFMLRLGRIPGVGDSIELGDRRLVVEGMSGQRVDRTRLSRPPEPIEELEKERTGTGAPQ